MGHRAGHLHRNRHSDRSKRRRHAVEVLVYSTPAHHALVFVKCAHFSVWDGHRESIVASLICAFELAGRPLADADVEALLST